MSFKDVQIKSCYESGIDDLIEDFYVPVLGEAVSYDRIAGFLRLLQWLLPREAYLRLFKMEVR